ncbi:OCIA domain-containing protein 1-like isoform X2 [Alligator mississippiensis]|uniref:OCIA domain-containing protein 1 isoform X2 n=1 Tax=Alligator mississippiensis TaxID=8496 RepID=UPI000907125C|nr:OCIA domain-containing protein 1 isoform X2 [Alligator mississippiensis]XP_059577713.1 OCIA domain-containing protein 1-like isoform X2 [Alligator mississippiensis]
MRTERGEEWLRYIPTEDERRLLRECTLESFCYRSAPYSFISMLLTSHLMKKGVITANSRFGVVARLLFVGIIGYFAGKVSYMPACREKFKRLKTSPLTELVQKGPRCFSDDYSAKKSQFADEPSQSAFGPAPTTKVTLPSSYSDEHSSTDQFFSNYEPVPFSASLNESSPTGITDRSDQEPVLLQEETPKRKTITYEELRNKNREAWPYKEALKEKQSPVQYSQERPFRKEAEVNKYGDPCEE